MNISEQISLTYEMMMTHREFTAKDINNDLNRTIYLGAFWDFSCLIFDGGNTQDWKNKADYKRLQLREDGRQTCGGYSRIFRNNKKYIQLAYDQFCDIIDSVDRRFIRGLQ